MRPVAWLLVLPAIAFAQDDKVAHGARMYAANCGVAYCHGPEGKPGRAPALAGRRLDARAIVAIATSGIPNTSMPGFGRQLKPEDLEAVAAYIVSLGGNEPNGSGEGKPAAVPMPPSPPPPAALQGRALFFDAARTGACGSCHEVGGRGVPVSLALQDLRTAHIGDLHAVATPDVVTARPAGEDPFPAVVSEKTARRVRVYDLSARLPVLRTFAPANVELTPGASWTHREAAGLYTDAELVAISRYLHWAAGR